MKGDLIATLQDELDRSRSLPPLGLEDERC